METLGMLIGMLIGGGCLCYVQLADRKNKTR